MAKKNLSEIELPEGLTPLYLDGRHKHVYRLEHIAHVVAEPSLSVITAWIYKCKCGHEIEQLTPSGIELIKAGEPYDVVIGTQTPGHRM